MEIKKEQSLKEKNQNYPKELLEKLKNGKVKKGKLKDLISIVIKVREGKFEDYQKEFFDFLLKDATSLKDVLDNGVKEFFDLTLSKKWSKRLEGIVLNIENNSYSTGLFRRSLHSKKLSYLKEHLKNPIMQVFFNFEDFSVEDYLTNPDVNKWDYYKPDIGTIEGALAYELNNGNKKIIGLIKDILYSENNTANMSYSIARSIIKSKNKELQKDLLNLLLAAKLQEGIRQMILESADLGSIDFLKQTVKVIAENNLIRFSSCMRAINTWMGLGYEADNQRHMKRILELMDYYLNLKTRNKPLKTEDSLELFVSLWATGVHEADETLPLLRKYLQGTKHQKLIAGYFLSMLKSLDVRNEFALEFIDEKDMDVFAYLERNLSVVGNLYFYRMVRLEFLKKIAENKFLQNKKEVEKLAKLFLEKVAIIPKEGYTVSQKPFEWVYYNLTRESLLRELLYMVAALGKEKYILEYMEQAKTADSNIRIWIVSLLLDPENPKDKEKIIGYLDDKSTPVREAVIKVLKNVSLNKEELEKITSLLRLKSGGIRQSIIELILSQSLEMKKETVDKLVGDKDTNKNLAGLDILLNLQIKEEIASEDINKYVEKLPKITDQGQILIDKLLSKKTTDEYSKNNGYGLFDRDYRPNFDIEYKETGVLKEFLKIKSSRLEKIVEELVKFVDKHKDDVFYIKLWDKSRQERIFGACNQLMITYENNETGRQNNLNDKFTDYFLHEEIADFIKSIEVSSLELLKIRFINYLGDYRGEYKPNYQEWALKFLKKELIDEENIKFRIWFKNVKYSSLINSMLNIYSKFHMSDEIFENSYSILVDFILYQKNPEIFKKNIMNPSKYGKDITTYLLSSKEIEFFSARKQDTHTNPENFIKSIALSYKMGALQEMVYLKLNVRDIARAVENEILPINELYRTFFNVNPKQKMNVYTSKAHKEKIKDFEEYPCIKIVTENVVERVIEIEMKRGDTQTDVSEMAKNIKVHYGIDHFVNILLALGKETFARGYLWGSTYTKKEVLSSLLKTCLPKEDDTFAKFKKAVKGKISDERLIEAVMYAPAWSDYLENYLGWKGVKSAIWYFHAHTSDSVSSENQSEIAPFSPISRVDFQDGAFDINWFNKTYKDLGAKRFELFYDSSKYISGGSTHRRGQLFADAVLGKLKARDLEKEIMDKRNKDKLLSYGLIPLGKKPEEEALKRYEFIHKFLKSSREFGAQRRESEKKASNISLGNLARNLGYDDINIFTWKMETLKLETISVYFEERKVDEYIVLLEVDTDGLSEILIKKDDKILKTTPIKIKKDKYLLELAEVKKSLKDQYSRARVSFENAMVLRSEFQWKEIKALINHPVINGIMKKLVFISGKKTGFVVSKGLLNYDGKTSAMKDSDTLMVAHSYDLKEIKVWSEYQKYLFDKKLIQPFKQIFRELYTVNEDEKSEKTISRRYAGHQIQPQKTVALLKSRGWNIYHDEGLQKVNFKENVIARMYAMADWFSPADIEAPTLETVEFFNRETRENIQLEKLNPVLFSEVMRDIDLVVSIAHVGGVDPETSHSTVEMRKILIGETIRLMKLSNVKIEGNFAKITGKIGEYNVHLGSGMVQMIGKGSINILAVQSQHRGRIFLPFLDEDPRTAEIVSKIELLANDNKIKDPMILSQIK
ncbi:DUF4132 domain-containing protein [Fusobacterium sp. PH5-44]|uniref:DUF4132 domain-containing protein n=1 Tax=unclassified Fusobacterium TaxID=2648384 RepID=UPI003D1FB4CB